MQSTYTAELYRNEKGSTYQCDLTNRIVVRFIDFDVQFKVQDFAAFRRKVNNVDIKSMLFDLSDNGDFKVLESPANQLSRRLTLCEIIQLRDLLNGTRFALDLKSMLQETLGELVTI
ncbi:hypothetical protein [Fibrella aquatica]|uniref:hypothetical protein n=1 Tax=Fibrella aquatica TaxID=3242487 RepID=UPI00351FE055